MTCAARWYAANAAAGMPFVEAVEMTWSTLPAGTPGAISPGLETLAGASMAPVGSDVPSGRVPGESPAAVALDAARLAVQAPESRASGTSAVAFCHVFVRLDI